jgi:hypothetical protein
MTGKNTYFNGVIEDYYEIVLQLPKPPSLNAFYAGRHWTSRTRAKESYFKSIEEELKEVPVFTAERFSLSVRYNCRFDVDNSIICIKFLADYLRNNDYVVDDTPKYFMKQSTAFDPSLEKNQFVATIKCHGFQRTE